MMAPMSHEMIIAGPAIAAMATPLKSAPVPTAPPTRCSGAGSARTEALSWSSSRSWRRHPPSSGNGRDGPRPKSGPDPELMGGSSGGWPEIWWGSGGVGHEFALLLSRRHGSCACRIRDRRGAGGLGFRPTRWRSGVGPVDRLSGCQGGGRLRGQGYHCYFGWVQTIRRTESAKRAVIAEVDLPACLGSDGVPMMAFGYLPSFYDAPANPHHPDGIWRASTFLVAIPDLVRSRVLEPVAGFGWGYRLAGGKPAPLPVEPLGTKAWNDSRRLLAGTHPRWIFTHWPRRPRS